MLISFEVNGYKLFDKKVEFSMHTNSRFKRLKENYVVETINKEQLQILKSAIIYGPNNSGKTTFIKSIGLLKSIVDKENIDDVGKDVLNFNFFSNDLKMEYLIEFLSDGKKYLYELAFNDKNEINKEILVCNDKIILDRYGENDPNVAKILDLLGHYKNKLMVMALPKDYLQIYNGFKKFFSKLIVLQYVDNNFESTIDILKDPEYREDFINLIKKSDTNIKEIKLNGDKNFDNIGYVPKDVAEYLKLESTYEKNGKRVSFPSILIDSFGTKKLVVYASYVLKALKEGCVLIVDELDSSWHTILTRNIFALFNSVSNTSSQLIATCHDLLLLDDENMFRRDQIWFTYKDTNGTYFYSLGDFKKEINEKKGSAMSNYLKGMYGALPYPELGDIANEE